MANDALNENDRGIYFNFNKTNKLPFVPSKDPIIRAKNPRTQKEGMIKTWIGTYAQDKYERRGRFENPRAGDWNVGDIVMIEDAKYCPTGMTFHQISFNLILSVSKCVCVRDWGCKVEYY